jgi:UDP-3-O-[3-hydroxymyristoyl] glucosamine N-acyltransferase
MKNLKIKHIIEKIGISLSDVFGDKNKILGSAASLTNIKKNQFTFCKEKNIDKLNDINDCVIIAPKSIKYNLKTNNTYIIVNNPRLIFARIMKLIYPQYIPPSICIGKNVIIEKTTIIGSDGFAFERNEKGEFEKFNQIGGVIIEDNVEIQGLSNVDRGTIDNTIIKEGTKIDTFCHIGHNTQIGKHCDIRAKTMIGGSVIIKDYVTIAPCVSIINGITIGKNSFIGMGSVVTKNIPDGFIFFGIPAKKIRINDYEF